MSGITLDSLDSIQITDGTDTLAINGDGSINATVSATDLDIRDLSASQDNVAISDGTDTLAVNADGSINVVSTATDLDIRDLVNTQDSIAIGDETNLIDLQQIDAAFSLTAWTFPISGVRRDADTSPVSADGDSHPLVFNDTGFLKVESNFASDADDAVATENPLAVGGVSAETATALAEISAAGDRAHLLQDMFRRLHVRNSNDVAWQVTPVTVGATETEIAATPLNGRKEVIIQNVSSNSVWVGEATGVTTTGATRGIEIPKKSSMSFPFGEALNLFVISDGAGREINVLEAA